MRSVHIKIISLKNHPCKRQPMPFIFVGCKLAHCDGFQKTKRSNALPPFWDQNFDFVFEDSQTNAIELAIAETRLMMTDEEIGQISIPISWLPYNFVVREWIQIKPSKKFVSDIRLLAMFHYCDPTIPSFSQELGQFIAPIPWNYIPVTEKDLESVWKPNDSFLPPVIPNDINQHKVKQTISRVILGNIFNNSDIPLVS